MPLLHRLQLAAEGAARRSPRVGGAHAAGGKVVLEQLQVRGELALHLGVGAIAADEREEPEEEAAQGEHGRAQNEEFSSSLSTSPASRRQRSVCSARARVPGRVMA